MIDSRLQFRVLYRDFLVRLIDLELISSGADSTRLFVQFAALLGAFSIVLGIYVVPQYALSKLAPDELALAATGDQEFLIATTMAVVGMFGIIAWDSVFPDRLDVAVLGNLPVRTRTIFYAKVAAISTGLGISIVAVNLGTGLSYPFVAIPPGGGALSIFRAFAAYWFTMAAAGAFVFCALLALQGLAAQFLSYRLFLRASNFLQIGAFFVILAGYFLTPNSTELPLTAPASRPWLDRFPSFWFLGLFEELNGPVHPIFGALAQRALWSLAIVIAIAAATYALAYLRSVRRIIEQPDIIPGDRTRPAARYVTKLVSKLVANPVQRAVMLFTARTLVRSRQQRTILAAYAGIGLAIALTYAKILLYGDTRIYAELRSQITVPRWNQLNVPLMAAGFVLIFFSVIGMRAVFALPATLKANWIFRITAVHRPQTYFSAVRKSVYGFAAVPLWITAAIVYLCIWPPGPAAAHLVILALAGIILIERSLFEFRKIPFACSYLPGKSDLKRKLVVNGTLFLLAIELGTRIELWTMESRSRYVVALGISVALAMRARQRWVAFASGSYHRLQFVDLEAAEVSPLDLRRDGAWGAERFIDDVDPEPERPWRVRVRSACLKAALAILVLALIGAGYEQYGQWQHRRHFPQIGRSVDIGGRSLNYFCVGEGGPTVLFESGAGGPGYGWVYVQREVSRFAKACWYDRAGYGWSDSAPYPHPSSAIAVDLHELVRRAPIPPPFVLVGASFGGFNVRVYDALYPDDVAGMVLVDSSHFDERERIPTAYFPHAQSMLAQVLRQVGLLRVFMDADPGPLPKGLTAQDLAITNSFEPKTLVANTKELFLESAKQARAARGLGDRPLVVLTAGRPPGQAHSPVEVRQAQYRQRVWIQMQQQLARLSTRGRQVVVPDSRHGIQFDAPYAVIAAIREVVMDVRQHGTINGL